MSVANVTDMTGKKGLIFGVANERSYASHIARSLVEAGAACYFPHLPGDKMAKRVRGALGAIGLDDPWMYPCDASSDESLDELFAAVAEEVGEIDFLVHSIAFANKEYLTAGQFHKTPRDVWTQALDISAYSLVAMAQRATPLMANGGSIVCLSYYGAEKVVPGYNVMGVAKAALEATTRYLAAELGGKQIRVNGISGGPIRTLSSMAVSSIELIMDQTERFAPLRRNITGEEVGQTALFLLSDAASAMTGEILHVDAGFSILSNFPSCNPRTCPGWQENPHPLGHDS